MGYAATVRGLVVPFRTPEDNKQRIGWGGEKGAQTRNEKERTSFARLREPKELDRLESRKKPGAPTQARARPQPARGLPGATSAPSPPPLAGRGGARAQKTPTSERAPAHPQLLARARPADQKRAANARRPGAGAGGPGQATRGGGPGREHRGRGPRVTPAPGTPGTTERKSF